MSSARLRQRLDNEYERGHEHGSRDRSKSCLMAMSDPEARYYRMAYEAGYAAGTRERAALIASLRAEALTVDQAADSIIGGAK